MCTFAVQPELVIKATMLFVYSFLLSLGMLVFDGSREWPWLYTLEDEVTAEEVHISGHAEATAANPAAEPADAAAGI
eukprot:scaffold19744_cov27-Phaeocystis_antarctica.AAC.1